MDVLFVETTGLADPRPFLRVFTQESFVQDSFTFKGTIFVVDGLRWEHGLKQDIAHTKEDTRDCEVLVSRGKDQLSVADLIVVNHTSLNSSLVKFLTD